MTYFKDKFHILQEALQLTRNMLDLARQQGWDELAAIEKQRQVLLQAVFPLDEDSPEMERLAKLLQTLIDTNHELIAQCQQGKQSLQLQMRDAKFTKKAVTAYQSN